MFMDQHRKITVIFHKRIVILPVDVKELTKNAGDQTVSKIFFLRLFIQQAPRGFSDLFRESVFGTINIDPDPDHNRRDRIVFHGYISFRQDPGNFFPVQKQIIHPFDLWLQL